MSNVLFILIAVYSLNFSSWVYALEALYMMDTSKIGPQIPPCSYWIWFITWEWVLTLLSTSISCLNSNQKTNSDEIWKRDRCSSGKIMLIHLTHNIILCYSKSLGSLLCTKASEPNIEPDWLWNSYQHKPSVETYIVDIMSQNCYMVLIFLLLRLLMVQNWFCYK